MGVAHNRLHFPGWALKSRQWMRDSCGGKKLQETQNVKIISLELGVFFVFCCCSRLDNEASFVSLFKGQGVMCKIPPPALVISSQRWHIRSAPGRQREWTCSGWTSARWQPRKPCTNGEYFIRLFRPTRGSSHSNTRVQHLSSTQISQEMQNEPLLHPARC